jgi:hypothetical protein
MGILVAPRNRAVSSARPIGRAADEDCERGSRRRGGGDRIDDRRLAGDVASRPGRHAFPGEPDDAAAFWCWVGGDGDWTLYGIDASGARVEMYEEYGPSDLAAPLAPDGIAAWF